MAEATSRGVDCGGAGGVCSAARGGRRVKGEAAAILGGRRGCGVIGRLGLFAQDGGFDYRLLGSLLYCSVFGACFILNVMY